MSKALKVGGKITLQMAYNPCAPFTNELPESVLVNGRKDLESVKADLSEQFSNAAIWFSNVSNYLKDLNGKTHQQFWATDWIYLHGEKSS